MALPQLTIPQVKILIPQASDICELDSGGQKLVFTGIILGQKYAFKFLRPNLSQSNDLSIQLFDDVKARVQREIETMQQCTTPHLVRMGPVGLESKDVDGEPIIYFSEEFIEGKNLQQYLRDIGVFPICELIKLGFHISDAINSLWQFSKIHRDIKPGNIMRRNENGEFVLLDLGYVFDLQDSSLSVGPVGTPCYFSPEQMDFGHRRSVMDFRSDLFSLGIVLYEMATGKHPFIATTSTTVWDVLGNISNITPDPPQSHRPDLPQNLNDIILRLLAKRPALRFRSIALFQRALHEAEEKGGIQ